LTPIIKLLGSEYAKNNSGIEVYVIDPPMGSSGGLRALAAGKIDVALSARTPKADEPGQAKPWLQTPLVLATSGKSKGLTRAQVADIYGGRKSTWDDNKPIRLILRGEQETETKLLRSMSPEVDAAVAGALKRTGLLIAENDLDALESLTSISGSLGTTNLGLVKISGVRLTIMTLDGVQPSIKTVEDGSYRLIRQFYLVTTNPSPSAAAFVVWLNSPAALFLARQQDYLPLK
jgi:phosphate transport system substrate-binding protein